MNIEDKVNKYLKEDIDTQIDGVEKALERNNKQWKSVIDEIDKLELSLDGVKTEKQKDDINNKIELLLLKRARFSGEKERINKTLEDLKKRKSSMMGKIQQAAGKLKSKITGK